MASTTVLNLIVVDGDVDANLRQEIHGVFGPAIDLLVPLLPAVAFDLGNGHALHPHGSERVANVVKLERFDDGDDQFHGSSRVRAARRAAEGKR